MAVANRIQPQQVHNPEEAAEDIAHTVAVQADIVAHTAVEAEERRRLAAALARVVEHKMDSHTPEEELHTEDTPASAHSLLVPVVADHNMVAEAEDIHLAHHLLAVAVEKNRQEAGRNSAVAECLLEGQEPLAVADWAVADLP